MIKWAEGGAVLEGRFLLMSKFSLLMMRKRMALLNYLVSKRLSLEV